MRNRPAEFHPCTAGGLGDLGSLTAAWLAQTTRLHMFLLSRSGRGQRRGALRWILHAAEQACATAIQCDIGRAEDVAGLLVRVAAAGPLRAVVHAGGALQDGTIGKQGVKSVRTAFAGKLQVSPALCPSLCACMRRQLLCIACLAESLECVPHVCLDHVICCTLCPDRS